MSCMHVIASHLALRKLNCAHCFFFKFVIVAHNNLCQWVVGMAVATSVAQKTMLYDPARAHCVVKSPSEDDAVQLMCL